MTLNLTHIDENQDIKTVPKSNRRGEHPIVFNVAMAIRKCNCDVSSAMAVAIAPISRKFVFLI